NATRRPTWLQSEPAGAWGRGDVIPTGGSRPLGDIGALHRPCRYGAPAMAAACRLDLAAPVLLTSMPRRAFRHLEQTAIAPSFFARAVMERIAPMRKLIVTIAMLAMLAGCTTAEQGAVIGGLGGAAIGGIATGRTSGAVAGGLIGA